MTISVNNQETLLPLKEFLLLFKLISYPGKIFSRKKLKDNPDFAITTVRGAGYRAEIKCRE